jgi:hypothetical protein
MDSPKQYVVLEHRAGGETHWDLMLEEDAALLTWRLEMPPEQMGNDPVKAVQIADHARRFLDYEGPVQQNTGTVTRVDRGTFRWIEKKESAFTAFLTGDKLSGLFRMERLHGGPDWVFIRQP